MGVESHSEYGGGGVMPNTVFPKGTEALTNSDILRLDSQTGQHVDSRAPVDPYHWYGGQTDRLREQELKEQERKRRAKLQQIRREEQLRYRESRR